MGGQGFIAIHEIFLKKIRVKGLLDLAIKSCAIMVGKFGPSEVFTTP
jgi:hypothetical protein